MSNRDSSDAVLLSIFFAAHGQPEVNVTDADWLKAIKPAARQQAVEDSMIELAQSQYIHRLPGCASLTLRGKAYIDSQPMGWRKAG